MDHVPIKRLETMKKRQADSTSPTVSQGTPKRRARESLVLGSSKRSVDSERPPKASDASLLSPSAGKKKPDSSFEGLPGDLASTHKDSSEELWGYIRPHLRTYNSPRIPTTCWVDKLIHLPRIRDLEWNTEFITAYPFRDYKTKDITAMIMHLTGRMQKTPCSKCKEGNGPFRGCVLISRDVPQALATSLSCCANCTYHYGDRFCDYNTRVRAMKPGFTETKRPSESRGAEQDIPGDNSEVESEDSLDGDVASQAAEGISERHWSEASDNSPNPGVAPPLALETAPSGRPYSAWLGKSRREQHIDGTI